MNIIKLAESNDDISIMQKKYTRDSLGISKKYPFQNSEDSIKNNIVDFLAIMTYHQKYTAEGDYIKAACALLPQELLSAISWNKRDPIYRGDSNFFRDQNTIHYSIASFSKSKSYANYMGGKTLILTQKNIVSYAYSIDTVKLRMYWERNHDEIDRIAYNRKSYVEIGDDEQEVIFIDIVVKR